MDFLRYLLGICVTGSAPDLLLCIIQYPLSYPGASGHAVSLDATKWGSLLCSFCGWHLLGNGRGGSNVFSFLGEREPSFLPIYLQILSAEPWKSQNHILLSQVCNQEVCPPFMFVHCQLSVSDSLNNRVIAAKALS